jgi:DNA mismatch repair protein MLH3
MPFSQPIIQALPSDVIAKIKSSTSIVHLTGVILELVKNSLDANAHTVFVTVDFKRGGCIVEDDGVGIPPIEFEAAGGLGRAHRMYSSVEGREPSMHSNTRDRYIQIQTK